VESERANVRVWRDRLSRLLLLRRAGMAVVGVWRGEVEVEVRIPNSERNLERRRRRFGAGGAV